MVITYSTNISVDVTNLLLDVLVLLVLERNLGLKQKAYDIGYFQAADVGCVGDGRLAYLVLLLHLNEGALDAYSFGALISDTVFRCVQIHLTQYLEELIRFL